MLIRRPADLPPSEITPERIWRQRRHWVQAAAAAGLLAGTGARAQSPTAARLPGRPSPLSTMEKPTPYKLVTEYVNFYEFGTEKDDPPRLAPRTLRLRPWTLVVDGEVRKPRRFDLEDLLKLAAMEERIYRLRCVEAWSSRRWPTRNRCPTCARRCSNGPTPRACAWMRRSIR